MNCVFCKIVNGEIPSNVLYQDDIVMVIMDIKPTTDGHVLIIPKKHYEDFFNVDDDVMAHMFKIAKMLGPKIMQKLKANSLTLLINYGDDQVVKHLHLHLLPDYLLGVKNGVKRSMEENYKILKEIPD